MPLDHAASLLAIHCLASRQTPNDYALMVTPAGNLLRCVATRASRLLDLGMAVQTPIRISRREQEVLEGILQNRANKEIAAGLNVSERTVKFHVSSLLSKFHVRDRVELMRHTTRPAFSWGSLEVGLRPRTLARQPSEHRVLRLPKRRLSA